MRSAMINLCMGLALVVAGCLVTPVVDAQEKVEVKFQVFPMQGVMLRMDDQAPVQGVSAVSVEPGAHRFRFWAPGFTVWDTALVVAQGSSVLLRKVLKHSPEHVAYQGAQRRLSRQKTAWRGLPLLTAGITGYLSLKAKKNHDHAYDDLLALRDTYQASNSATAIGVIKQESLPGARAEVDRTRRALTINLALFGVALGTTAYGFIRAGKLERPTYEDKDRVRFEGIGWIPDAAGGTWATGLIILIR